MTIIYNFVKKHSNISELIENYDEEECVKFWEVYSDITFNNKKYKYKLVIYNPINYTKDIIINKLAEKILLDLGNEKFIELLTL